MFEHSHSIKDLQPGRWPIPFYTSVGLQIGNVLPSKKPSLILDNHHVEQRGLPAPLVPMKPRFCQAFRCLHF
jgi:hypothetical protein